MKKKIELQTDKKIKKVRFDNNKKFKSLTENNENEKIEFEFIISYTHKQNDIAERMNWILIIIMRVLIFKSKILKNFWAFAAEAAYYIRNKSVMMKSMNEFDKKMKKISYKFWIDKKFQIVHMKI